MNLDNRQKVLELFFEYPNKEYHLRQLARETRIHPNTIMTLSKELADEELIVKWKERNLVLMKANIQGVLYKAKKQAHNIEKIIRSGFLEFLNSELAFPTIILFGSYAKAENYEKSDIDLFIIAETKKKLNLSQFEKKLGREIQLFLHTPEEFRKLKKDSPELINNVINGYKLSGYLEVI
ncbi:nucleotidyltransferase domain-containing protein [Candidatus Woesearchaeota archaeon]|nr:nucleotidyltransferase domain-containing protein [Candidatus Woesearchaeota archaeon]